MPTERILDRVAKVEMPTTSNLRQAGMFDVNMSEVVARSDKSVGENTMEERRGQFGGMRERY